MTNDWPIMAHVSTDVSTDHVSVYSDSDFCNVDRVWNWTPVSPDSDLHFGVEVILRCLRCGEEDRRV